LVERKDKVLSTIDDEAIKTWRNVAQTCERVLVGQTISVNVQGGWVSRPAPLDGYVFKSGDTNLYVPDFVMKKRRAIPAVAPARAHASHVMLKKRKRK
jgi:hypothetical protein